MTTARGAHCATRTARSDSLPFTREHRRLLLGSGAGWAFDAMDVGLISFVLAQLAQLPGYAAAAVLVERWGRRPTLAVFLLGAAVSAGLFAGAAGPIEVLTAGMLMSFCDLGAWGALYAITPELYPTRLRGTGAGWAAGVGRVAAILAPLTVFAVVFVVAALGALRLPERCGLVLDE